MKRKAAVGSDKHRVLSVGEVAALAGLSPKGVALHDAVLCPMRTGRGVRIYRPETVAAWLVTRGVVAP